MGDLFASGHAVDLVLLVVAAEFAWLRLRPHHARVAWSDHCLALLPGVCLLLAVRCALTGAPWPWVAAALAASLPFHLADLARRRL